MNNDTGVVINGDFYPIPFLNVVVDLLTQSVITQLQQITDSDPKKFIDEENYLVREVALKVKKSNSTITRHCKKGLIKAQKVGKSWIIPKQSYIDYISPRKFV